MKEEKTRHIFISLIIIENAGELPEEQKKEAGSCADSRQKSMKKKKII
ncbi:hypothetical protein LKD46_15500 [Blautia sp. CLA-AA-H275]|nr:hypothetical protein [Blautia fusiformis]